MCVCGGRGGGLPTNRLKKMCRWMDWTGLIITDLYFSRVSRTGLEIFGILGGKHILVRRIDYNGLGVQRRGTRQTKIDPSTSAPHPRGWEIN